MRAWWISAFLAAISALNGYSAMAQGRAPNVVAVTVLATPGGTVLADVELQLAGLPLKVKTDSAGAAFFRDVPQGSRSIKGRRLGYAQASAIVTVGTGDTTNVTLFMQAMNAELPVVSVTEKSVPVNLREFEERRRRGMGGRYLTQDQIDAAVGANLNTLVRRLGLQADQVVWNHSGRRGRCTLTAFSNGFHVRGDTVTNVDPLQLAGVEYYTGPSIPVQYRTGTNAQCGVILFWSK
jgi:hypothetical protein